MPVAELIRRILAGESITDLREEADWRESNAIR